MTAEHSAQELAIFTRMAAVSCRMAARDFAMRVSPMALVLMLTAAAVAGQGPDAAQTPANPTPEVAGETPAGLAIVAGPTEIRIGGYLGLTGTYRTTAGSGCRTPLSTTTATLGTRSRRPMRSWGWDGPCRRYPGSPNTNNRALDEVTGVTGWQAWKIAGRGSMQWNS